MAFRLDRIEKQIQNDGFSQIKNLLEKEIVLSDRVFNNKKKEVFYTELSVLLNAGISLKDSLTLIFEEKIKSKEKEIIQSIIDNLIRGKSFSEAIRIQKYFSEYEYYSLRIGEETGTLSRVTKELGLFYRRKNEQRKNVINALSYPLIVLSTAVLSVFFMLKYVVPMFADIFAQNKAEIPWLTRLIIEFSNRFQEYLWVFLIIIVGMVILGKVIKNNQKYQRIKSAVILKIPFAGELVRKMYIAQFTQAFALLSNAKVPVLTGVQLTKKMIRFYPLETALEKVEKDLIKGESFYKSLKSHKIFDNKMVSLIKVAEETNQNEYVFDRLSVLYNEEIQDRSKMLSTIIEPLIIIVLGALVAVILIAMYLPMFKLSTVLN